MNQPFKTYYSSTSSGASPFLSACGAKSNMQAPENTQNYNRFAYCLNNSMKYTDPIGFTSYYVNGVQVSFQDYRMMGDAKFTSSAYGNSSYLFDFGISKDKNTAPEKAHARLQRVIYLPQNEITSDGSNLETVFVLAQFCSCFVRVKNAHVHAFTVRQLGYGSFEKTIPWHKKSFWEIMASDGDFGYDGANRGSITKQDVIVGTAVIATIASGGILAEYAMAGASVWEWTLASASAVNNIDGIFTNSNGESGIQQMVNDKYKMNVGAAKNLVSLLSLQVSFSPSNINNTYKSGFVLTGVGTDFFSIMQPNKSYIKKR